MKHFDEYTLDLYVLGSDLMDQDTREAIPAHLDVCPGCRKVVEELRDFYRQLDKSAHAGGPDVEILMDHLFPPAPIMPLRPFDASADSGIPGASALAAMTTTAEQSVRFETVAVLASADDHAVVRIQHDRQADTYRLYFHSDESRCQEGGIVSLSEPRADFVLDEQRQVQFHLPEGTRPPAWDGLGVSVRFPVASIQASVASLKEKAITTAVDPTKAYTVTFQRQHGQIQLKVKGPADKQDVSFVVIKALPGEAALMPLVDGEALLTLETLPDEFLVRLYV